MADIRRFFSDWLATSVRRKHLDRELEHLKPSVRGRVLEVGAGARRRGHFSPPLADGETVQCWHTLDISQEREPDMQADAQCLPLDSESYDLCVSLEMLEYVPEPHRALAEMHRVLAGGGRIILSVPFMHRQDSPHDLWRWTKAGLVKVVEAAGFVVVDVRQQAHGLGVAANILKYSVYSMQSKLLRYCMAIILFPVVSLLWRLDAFSAEKIVPLRDFTTGLIIVAEKKQKCRANESAERSTVAHVGKRGKP